MAGTVRPMRRVEERALRMMRQDLSRAKARSVGGSEPGVVAVELLVVLGLFAVVVVRGSEGGAGALVGPVRQHKDLPGQAGLDDAVGTGRGQVMCAAGRRPGAVLPVFLRVVRLIGADAVGGDQRAVNDDVVALTEAR